MLQCIGTQSDFDSTKVSFSLSFGLLSLPLSLSLFSFPLFSFLSICLFLLFYHFPLALAYFLSPPYLFFLLFFIKKNLTEEVRAHSIVELERAPGVGFGLTISGNSSFFLKEHGSNFSPSHFICLA